MNSVGASVAAGAPTVAADQGEKTGFCTLRDRVSLPLGDRDLESWMTHQCAACGTTFSDADICPSCQLPVKPPETSTAQPPVSPMSAASASSTSAEEPSAGGKAPTPKKLRWPLVIGIGVASLALVAGLAFAGVKSFGPGGAFGGPVQLVITGEPPNTAGSWANGVQEVWRVSGTHGDDRIAGSYSSGTGGPTGWVFRDLEGDITSSLWAYDPATGARLWDASGLNGRNISCQSRTASGVAACIDERNDSLVLMDLHTGKAKTQTSLQKLGIKPDSEYISDVYGVGGQIVVALRLYPDASLPNWGDVGDIIVARVSPEGHNLIWQTRLSGCEYDTWKGANWIPEQSMLQHGALFAGTGSMVNFDTGQSLVPPGVCAQPIADGAVYLESPQSGSVPNGISAPDHSRMAVVTEYNSLRIAGEIPPVALRVSDVNATEEWMGGAKVGTASLEGYDPASGRSLWAKPATISVYTANDSLNAGPILYDGTRLIVGGVDTTVAIDPVTGTQLWTKQSGSISLEAGAYGAFMSCYVEDGPPTCDLIDAATGVSLAEFDGEAGFAPSAGGVESIELTAEAQSDDGTAGYLARLDPADRPVKAPVVPKSAPACPDGMTAISWTQYSDGGILLCHSDQKYAVVYPSHPDWQAAQLNFTGGGHEVVFSNGTRIRVSLGGSVVYTDADGKTTTQTATEAWNNATGEVKVSVPKDLKTCPANSWPISLSTYDGGWLLVCGTNADAPTSMVYHDGSRTVDLGSVGYQNGGYCGTGDVGTVCGYRAPAVVSVTDASGKVTQHSVGGNYFDDHGAGGVGQGTGSYGVEAPTDTAKDQVRYLTQILQKSAAGRANLDAAVAQVRSCSNMAGAITTINGVIANRQELLDALASTPVDAVPNGSELVAKLRNALELSLKSDKVWLQWAQSEQSNSCAEGENSATYKQVEAMNRSVATAKDAFVAAWNSQISGAYKAPRFATSQI